MLSADNVASRRGFNQAGFKSVKQTRLKARTCQPFGIQTPVIYEIHSSIINLPVFPGISQSSFQWYVNGLYGDVQNKYWCRVLAGNKKDKCTGHQMFQIHEWQLSFLRTESLKWTSAMRADDVLEPCAFNVMVVPFLPFVNIFLSASLFVPLSNSTPRCHKLLFLSFQRVSSQRFPVSPLRPPANEARWDSGVQYWAFHQVSRQVQICSRSEKSPWARNPIAPNNTPLKRSP